MPVTAGAISGGVQSLIGGVQSIAGMIQAHKAQKKLEGMVDNYKPNASILDFYNKALNRYNVNPYNSETYQMNMKNANRNLLTGLSSARDRRGALGSLPSLVQGANDASQRATSQAENEQSRNLSQLGSATQMKAAEDFKPFELRYNLLSAKAAGGNQIMNAGIGNAYGGLGSIQDINMANRIYGYGGNRRSPATSFSMGAGTKAFGGG